jgi:hypothetical protein
MEKNSQLMRPFLSTMSFITFMGNQLQKPTKNNPKICQKKPKFGKKKPKFGKKLTEGLLYLNSD